MAVYDEWITWSKRNPVRFEMSELTSGHELLDRYIASAGWHPIALPPRRQSPSHAAAVRLSSNAFAPVPNAAGTKRDGGETSYPFLGWEATAPHQRRWIPWVTVPSGNAHES
jgi:hypothetical protein